MVAHMFAAHFSACFIWRQQGPSKQRVGWCNTGRPRGAQRQQHSRKAGSPYDEICGLRRAGHGWAHRVAAANRLRPVPHHCRQQPARHARQR